MTLSNKQIKGSGNHLRAHGWYVNASQESGNRLRKNRLQVYANRIHGDIGDKHQSPRIGYVYEWCGREISVSKRGTVTHYLRRLQ